MGGPGGRENFFSREKKFFPSPRNHRPLSGAFSKEEEFEGADDGEGHDDVVEEFLGHFFEEEDSDGGADDDDGEHEEVEFDGLESDASFGGEDGDFDPVDDEEEPGSGAHILFFGEFHGEEVEGGDGTGGVGQLGGDAEEDAVAGGGAGAGGEGVGSEAFAYDAEEGETEDDGADEDVHGAGVVGGDETEYGGSDGETGEGPGEEAQEDLPVGVAVVPGDGHDVGHGEHSQLETGGESCLEGGGQKDDGQKSDAGDGGLVDADEKGRQGEDEQGSGPDAAEEFRHDVSFFLFPGKGGRFPGPPSLFGKSGIFLRSLLARAGGDPFFCFTVGCGVLRAAVRRRS